MNLNTNTLLNMLSTKTSQLANTQVLKNKIQSHSVNGTVDIQTLVKDKSIGTLINQLFKDILSGVKTKGEVTQLLSNNKQSFSFKNLSSDIKSIVSFLTALSASQTKNPKELSSNHTIEKQIAVLKNSLLDLKNINSNELKSNITNSGVLLESKLLNNNTTLSQDIKSLLNQIKEHVQIKEQVITQDSKTQLNQMKEQLGQNLNTKDAKVSLNEMKNPTLQDTKLLLNEPKNLTSIQTEQISNKELPKQQTLQIDQGINKDLAKQQTSQTQVDIQNIKEVLKQNIKLDNIPLKNVDLANNISNDLKLEIKADVQKILQAIQTTQHLDTSALKQISLLQNVEQNTNNLEQKLQNLNIKNDIASNLKEVVSQVREQIVNKNFNNLKILFLQIEEKIENIKAEPNRQEFVNNLKEDLKSIKNNILNQTITKETVTQINNFQNKLSTPIFQELLANNKVNITNLPNDLKATILQIKEQIDVNSSLNKELITKEVKATVDKVLSQIEFYQLVSYSSSSTTIPLSFLQEDIEDAKIEFNENNDDNFSCQINLTLTQYGEIKVLLVMDKSNNLNINFAIENETLKTMVQSSLQKLRLGIGNTGAALQSLNVFNLDATEKTQAKSNLYGQNENLSFGLDIKA
jgi:hypothetical protein